MPVKGHVSVLKPFVLIVFLSYFDLISEKAIVTMQHELDVLDIMAQVNLLKKPHEKNLYFSFSIQQE